MKQITSISELTNVLSSAKNGGQYAYIYGTTDVDLRKFPTDGSERIHIKDDFKPRKSFHIKYNFGEDYDNAMSKVTGTSYTAHDDNRIHLVHNLLMRYISTNNVCLICMPKDYTKDAVTLNGVALTSEQEEYMAHYLPKPSKRVLDYYTIGVSNISKLVFGGETYNICIPKVATRLAV